MSSKKFPKSNRLLSKGDFSHLKSGSSSVKSQWIMAFTKDHLNLGSETRLGISASRKVGNAVKRNMVKRQVREFFRNSDYKNLGKDLLIVVHPKLFFNSERNFKVKMKSSLKQVFKKIRADVKSS